MSDDNPQLEWLQKHIVAKEAELAQFIAARVYMSPARTKVEKELYDLKLLRKHLRQGTVGVPDYMDADDLYTENT